MKNRSSLQRAISDRGLDLETRIEALQQFVDAGANGDLIEVISIQIENELAGNDTRFVIYLIGAVRKIFDRRAIDVFASLIELPIDLSFRIQSLIGLRELYRHSVRRRLLASPNAGAHPSFTQHISVIDENFIVHGSDLTDDDLRKIEQVLLTVSENKDAIGLLRDEARQCYAVCQTLGSLIQSDQL